MTKIKHPNNKAERLFNAEKKARARKAQEDRASRVRAKLARETLKVKELEDAVGEVG